MRIKNISFYLSFYILLSILAFPVKPDIVHFNINDYGAKGDGVTLNTRAIQQAIDVCAKGGGMVYIPAGTYLSGSLVMRSHVNLHISEGAILLGSTNINDYDEKIPKIRSYTDQYVKQSLIYGEDLENIAITGKGLIDGQGSAFKSTTNKKPDRYKNRPYLIRLINCKKVWVEDISLKNSAMWMQHYLACDQLFIRGINVYNHCNKNNDMIDIDGCSNVLVSDCIGDTDDDALTIKSTSDRISKNIVVTNCILSSHCNAIKLGTESHGGFENINISNCVVKPSVHPTKFYGFKNGISGITLGMVDGGRLDGVIISNIRIDGPKVPIYMRLGDRGRIYKEGMSRPAVGIFQNVSLSNIIATNADTLGCSITGIPGHPIEGVSLSNIRIRFRGGAKNDVDPKSVKEEREHYPESTMFGKLPSYGLFIRHVNNIHLSNIEMDFDQPDERSVIVCNDVKQIELIDVRGKGTKSGAPLIQFYDVKNALIASSRPLNEINTFLSILGNCEDICLSGNDLRRVNQAVLGADHLPSSTFQLNGNFFKNDSAKSSIKK
jgi:hypothetical protein